MCRDVLASRELLGVAHILLWHAYQAEIEEGQTYVTGHAYNPK